MINQRIHKKSCVKEEMVLLSASCSDDFPKNQAYSNKIPIWNWTKIGIKKHKFPIGTTSIYVVTPHPKYALLFISYPTDGTYPVLVSKLHLYL